MKMSNHQNPYSLTFGKVPPKVVNRTLQENEIYEAFTSPIPPQMIYMITGVRGSGKTVMLTDISKHFCELPDWIVLELNPESDLLSQMVAKLYETKGLSEIFRKAKLNLSLFGISVELDNKTVPIASVSVALERMLEQVKKKGKKVLVTIDEVTSNEHVRLFASEYQILIRQDLPLFALMAGLYENIDTLQNEKTLTFLYRASKIRLAPLNLAAIAGHYQKTFGLSDTDARDMAKLTKGYPFAFQVLGYYTFKNGGDYKSSLISFRQHLDEYVYDKIWSELSLKDRKVLYVTSETKDGKISKIRETLEMESNEFSPYRERLIKKGLLNGDERGYVRFVLPMFEEYVHDHFEM